jgi:hypothetical protein
MQVPGQQYSGDSSIVGGKHWASSSSSSSESFPRLLYACWQQDTTAL